MAHAQGGMKDRTPFSRPQEPRDRPLVVGLTNGESVSQGLGCCLLATCTSYVSQSLSSCMKLCVDVHRFGKLTRKNPRFTERLRSLVSTGIDSSGERGERNSSQSDPSIGPNHVAVDFNKLLASASAAAIKVAMMALSTHAAS